MRQLRTILDAAEKVAQYETELEQGAKEQARLTALVAERTKERDDARKRGIELRSALLNIKAHAGSRVGSANELGQIFFPALRDYADQIANPPGPWYNTSGVSAAARWGVDFTKQPDDGSKAPARRTY